MLHRFGRLAVAIAVTAVLTATAWMQQQGVFATRQLPVTADKFWAHTQAEFSAQGQKAYADRPVDVQAAMNTMWDNDGRYTNLSTLFVDHAPGDLPASVRVEIAQPYTAVTEEFMNDGGTGSPREETERGHGTTLRYSPEASVYTTGQNRDSATLSLPPLANVPLSLAEPGQSQTNLLGGSPQTVLANMLIHPSGLITSSWFTSKDVTMGARTSFAGRAVWELVGRAIPGTPNFGALGDGLRMLVDKQSGIVLRVEYYSGSALVGWAQMKDVAIDPVGAATLNQLRIPATARKVDGLEYMRLLALVKP